MEEKKCPEPGCGGVLEQEKNANIRIQQIFVCVKCGARYKTMGNNLKKMEGRVERIKCATC